MRFLILAAICIATGVSPVAAATVYVNNLSGNNLYNGRAEKLSGDRIGPVRSIERALRLAMRGDRIELANTGQPYRERITLFGRRNSGLEGHPFILSGNGATLEGADPVPHTAWRPYSNYVLSFRPSGLTHQQLFRDARPLTRRTVTNPSLGLPKLKPLEWALHGSRIYLRVEKKMIPEDYAITYAKRRTGITLVNVEHLVIKDLTVQGFQIDGVSFHTGNRKCTLLDVTARGNGRSGVRVGAASRVTINRGVLGSNGVAQIRTEPGALLRVIDSEIFAEDTPRWDDRGGRLIINRQDARDIKMDVDAPPPKAEN
jgi:hypothetical protein